MRIWSLHPTYLDSKGLVALWREGLLAFHVLAGNTKGYVNHPQLLRFRSHPEPLPAINAYLHEVADEAKKRDYSFKREKLDIYKDVGKINVTSGQLLYEVQHLKSKLLVRDKARHDLYLKTTQFTPHPLFNLIDGNIESWERLHK